MPNRLLIYILAVVLVVLCPPLIGAYHYGVLGFFAGVAVAFILLKLITTTIRRRFEGRMVEFAKRLEEEAQLLEGSGIEILELKSAAAGVLLEGDDAELSKSYPSAYQLEVKITPAHSQSWKPECMNLVADFDESLVTEDQDPEECGCGLYTYSITQLKDGNSVTLSEASGPVVMRLHFAVGAAVKNIKLQAHEKVLKNIELIG